MQDYKPNTVGFIRLTHPSQHIIGFIRLLTVKPTSTIRTNQASSWVSEELNKDIINNGFLKLSNQGLHMSKIQQGTSKTISNWVLHGAKEVDMNKSNS